MKHHQTDKISSVEELSKTSLTSVRDKMSISTFLMSVGFLGRNYRAVNELIKQSVYFHKLN